MTIQTNATDRKKLAKSIAEFTGNEIHYMGPPTFAYAVGNYIIDRAGVITSESEEGEAELRTHLETQGFLDREITELAVSVPLMDMDAEAMKRLVFMLHSQAVPFEQGGWLALLRRQRGFGGGSGKQPACGPRRRLSPFAPNTRARASLLMTRR